MGSRAILQGGQVRNPAEASAAVAVDVVTFAIEQGRLQAALVPISKKPRSAQWAFPGGRVRAGEFLEDAVQRVLGRAPDDLYLEQLRTFGDPGRDPKARVVSIAYLALAADGERLRAANASLHWFPVEELPPLAYDHEPMARTALDRLRGKLGYTNIVYGLLAEEFTLGELQDVYEIILGRALDRRNFRKKIIATGLIRPLDRHRGGAHRPARLHRFTCREPTIVEML